jgi:hypothetical protein
MKLWNKFYFSVKSSSLHTSTGLILFLKIFAHKNQNLSLNEYLFLIYMFSDRNLILNFLRKNLCRKLNEIILFFIFYYFKFNKISYF